MLAVAQGWWQKIATGQPQNVFQAGAMDLRCGGREATYSTMRYQAWASGFQGIGHAEAIHLDMQVVWQIGHELTCSNRCSRAIPRLPHSSA
jgi:hypothetical protein